MNTLPTRILPHAKQGARGFTLIELLMSILLMGLSISGLFGFLFWGQMNYAEVGSNWRREEILCEARRTIRQVITSSRDVALPDLHAFLQKKLSSSRRIKLERFTLEPYPPLKDVANSTVLSPRWGVCPEKAMDGVGVSGLSPRGGVYPPKAMDGVSLGGPPPQAPPPGAVFVKAVFFDDVNRNGRRDQSEPTIDRLWCYRGRTP